jgi:hypothetical protein
MTFSLSNFLLNSAAILLLPGLLMELRHSGQITSSEGPSFFSHAAQSLGRKMSKTELRELKLLFTIIYLAGVCFL